MLLDHTKRSVILLLVAGFFMLLGIEVVGVIFFLAGILNYCIFSVYPFFKEVRYAGEEEGYLSQFEEIQQENIYFLITGDTYRRQIHKIDFPFYSREDMGLPVLEPIQNIILFFDIPHVQKFTHLGTIHIFNPTELPPGEISIYLENLLGKGNVLLVYQPNILTGEKILFNVRLFRAHPNQL